jgi:hypothetical protein
MPFTVNRWLSARFNLVSAAIVGATGLVCLVTPSISASFAGFALAFASTISGDLLFMVLIFLMTKPLSLISIFPIRSDGLLVWSNQWFVEITQIFIGMDPINFLPGCSGARERILRAEA